MPEETGGDREEGDGSLSPARGRIEETENRPLSPRLLVSCKIRWKFF